MPKIRVLITVKTYPLPSKSHKELVCTAGVKEDGSFIRLYPIDYRYRPYAQWFKKYQWVEVEVIKHPRDPRPESYKPIGKIISLGPPVGSQNNWKERMKYVLAKGTNTMCFLNRCKKKEKSLGIIRPLKISGFFYKATTRNWKPQWLAVMKQYDLFEPDRKPLEKIPYKFKYRFKCEEAGCKGHTMMIEDWEVGELYRRMRDKFRNEKKACEKVEEKFYNQICGPKIDTHFFVGTVARWQTWVVIGAFYPRK